MSFLSFPYTVAAGKKAYPLFIHCVLHLRQKQNEPTRQPAGPSLPQSAITWMTSLLGLQLSHQFSPCGLEPHSQLLACLEGTLLSTLHLCQRPDLQERELFQEMLGKENVSHSHVFRAPRGRMKPLSLLVCPSIFHGKCWTVFSM